MTNPGVCVYGSLRALLTGLTLLFVSPLLLVAFAPLLLMLLPVAVVGIPLLVPVMWSGRLAARCESTATEPHALAASTIEAASAALR